MDAGVNTALSGEEDLTFWRFLMPLDLCFTGERNFVFWTWAARAVSLNAHGAVAGAGVSRILGVFFDMHFFGMSVLDVAVGVDGRIGGNGRDDSAAAGKNTCGLSMFIGLESGPI